MTQPKQGWPTREIDCKPWKVTIYDPEAEEVDKLQAALLAADYPLIRKLLIPLIVRWDCVDRKTGEPLPLDERGAAKAPAPLWIRLVKATIESISVASLEGKAASSYSPPSAS